MKQDLYYGAADFFLTRFAILPYKDLEPTSESLRAFYHNSPLFREAVAVASPSLHQALESQKYDLKIFQSLLKYYLRMISRATPFGLFSAIGWGEFKEKADCHLSATNLKAKASPDSEAIHRMICEIHQQKDFVSKLKVMTNFHLVKHAGRVLLKSNKELDKGIDHLSIKNSVVSDFIFHHSKAPIMYADLEEKLLAAFDEHPKERVSAYLWDIFEKGYLVSELTGCLNEKASILKYFEILKKIGWPLEGIEKLLHVLEDYHQGSFGQCLPLLNEASQNIPHFEGIKTPLQVNSFRNEGVFHLPHPVKELVEEVVSLLYLHSSEDPSPLESYHAQFQEKYGNHRLVPLMELIDHHLGLGFPSPTIPNGSSFHASWKELLFSSMKGKSIEIKSFPPVPPAGKQLRKAPLSFELYFELLGSAEDLQSGNYTLMVIPTGSTNQAGSTFGRFLPLCKTDQIKELVDLLQKEESLYPQAQFVEASFLPVSPRSANVISHEKCRPFQLKMHYHEASTDQLELEDIYVGATPERLYLYSKKWNKELYITLSSAINPLLAPSTLQLLLQISKSPFTTFSPYFWKGAESEIFLPRVTYKNVILSPARWRLTYSQLDLSDHSPLSAIEKVLSDHLIQLEIPDFVYLTEFDNRLIVNWKNNAQFQLIVQHFKSKKELLLFEVPPTHPSSVTSEQGFHRAEFVVPCVKKEAYKIADPPFHYPVSQQIRSIDRLQLPGSEWLYFKFFVSKESEENFLKIQLQPFIQEWLEQGLIKKWFYVRYKEDKTHLRLRFNGDREVLLQQLLPFITNLGNRWIANGLLREFSIHPYEREIERYGGPACIELAEDIFYADSMTTLYLLEQGSSLGLPLSFLGAMEIINIVQEFYPHIKEQNEFFSPYLNQKHLLSGIREHTPKAIQMAASLFSDTESNSRFKEMLNMTKYACFGLNEVIKNTTIQWSDKSFIVQSLVHMHCNRLFGPNREAESKAIVTAHHLLEKLAFLSTKTENICKR